MTDDFLANYILSLFNKNTIVTIKQLSLIASGKRTPSVLFNVEKNKLYALFALFPELSIKDWERIIHLLIAQQCIMIADDHLKITPVGLKEKENFKKDFPFINNLDQLRYATTKQLFWSRFIFITQIFSEYSYQNKDYVPYLSNLDNQLSIKKWLVGYGKAMDELTLMWFEELNALLRSFSTDHSNFIAGHFVGHNINGSTSRQIQNTHDLSTEHYKVLIDQLSYKIALRDENSFPLISSLWKHTYKDSDEGLSHSVWISKKMLGKGISLNEVAKRRKLKDNTIKEHILECVLIEDWPYYKQYISATHYTELHSLFESKQVSTYAEAKTIIEGLDFFSYRLIEIERIRQND
ncbi:helix-turn-helix domain-containing protein [Alkalibacterium sp. f15]|uniref:helix-turn-helix domain-containing protein n=1 Tax=Alkalibacterium sp. f15 TaxID=3414029 RepID=UPI003BF83A48